MKKSLFVLATGLLATTSAMAMDVSHPFYVPMKGDFLSETGISYTNYEHGYTESLDATETLSYGVTKNFSVNATVGDTWVLDAPGFKGHDRYDNPAWGLGVKYNLIDCCKTNWKVQLGANYDQGGVDKQDQELSAYAKAGYQIKNFLPYATVAVEKPIGRNEEDPTWVGRAALNTAFSKKVNLDLGATYTWNSAKKEWRAGSTKHESDWTADATLNYVFSDCMSVGLTGKYLLDVKPYNQDAYQVGVNFKVAF